MFMDVDFGSLKEQSIPETSYCKRKRFDSVVDLCGSESLTIDFG